MGPVAADLAMLEQEVAVIRLGEVFQTPNGRRFMLVGNSDYIGMACVADPLDAPVLGALDRTGILKTGHGFAVVDKSEFFSLYKKVD